MSDSEENYYNLRSRRVERSNPATSQAQTSTPIRRLPPRFDQISRTIQGATQFFRELSNRVDQNISVQHLSTLFPSLEDPSIFFMMNQQPGVYNKEIADLMTNNIPKFELSSSANPALHLRSFIKSCENVLSLFQEDDEPSKQEFFKLIKFRLGYDVLERITLDKFESIQDLEAHLRSICHLKLNKGRLLNEIRNERQHNNEDVSHFVERLRKLIAQGRSEYTNDREFEREAIHTLKNAVKSELISIKLMDSNNDRFEDLAEVAINRDSELHQRSYNITKTESSKSQELIHELMQKIKDLETKQTATIQHIREEPRLRPRPPNRLAYNTPFRPSQKYCNYCKRSGHIIDECRSRDRNNQRNGHNQNQSPTRNYERPNYPHNRHFINQNNRQHSYRNQQNNNPQQSDSRNYSYNQSHGRNHNYRSNSPESRNINTQNTPPTCIRCNQPGHKSNNCYEIICSICKQIGHSHSQCQQNRRVHFLKTENCEHCNQQQAYEQNQTSENE